MRPVRIGGASTARTGDPANSPVQESPLHKPGQPSSEPSRLSQQYHQLLLQATPTTSKTKRQQHKRLLYTDNTKTHHGRASHHASCACRCTSDGSPPPVARRQSTHHVLPWPWSSTNTQHPRTLQHSHLRCPALDLCATALECRLQIDHLYNVRQSSTRIR